MHSTRSLSSMRSNKISFPPAPRDRRSLADVSFPNDGRTLVGPFRGKIAAGIDAVTRRPRNCGQSPARVEVVANRRMATEMETRIFSVMCITVESSAKPRSTARKIAHGARCERDFFSEFIFAVAVEAVWDYPLSLHKGDQLMSNITGAPRGKLCRTTTARFRKPICAICSPAIPGDSTHFRAISGHPSGLFQEPHHRRNVPAFARSCQSRRRAGICPENVFRGKDQYE